MGRSGALEGGQTLLEKRPARAVVGGYSDSRWGGGRAREKLRVRLSLLCGVFVLGHAYAVLFVLVHGFFAVTSEKPSGLLFVAPWIEWLSAITQTFPGGLTSLSRPFQHRVLSDQAEIKVLPPYFCSAMWQLERSLSHHNSIKEAGRCGYT